MKGAALLESRGIALFGGFLIGRVWRDTSALLDPIARAQPRRYQYLFENPAKLGDRLRLSARVKEVDGVACAVDWLLLGGETAPARVASGSVEVCPLVASGGALLDSALVARRWVVADATEASGLLSPERLASIADEAAVIYCRDRMKVRRVVTRQVSDYVVHSTVPLDEVIEAHCGIVRQGRTSLTVDCNVVRKTEHNGHSQCAQLVLSCRLVMVALDAQGAPTLHARSIPAARPSNENHSSSSVEQSQASGDVAQADAA